MIRRIHKLLEYVLGEAGGVSDELLNPPSDDDNSEDEDEDDLNEELFSKRVVDGKVVKKKNDFLSKRSKPKNIHSNTNLMKARLYSRTPKAKLKRKKSMLVRRREVDRDR